MLNRVFYFMAAPIRYYDFYVAAPNTNPSEWKYQAWKIAALSPEMACYAKMLLHVGDSPVRTRKFSLSDGLYLAHMSIRLIVEFELVHREGKTKYRFKKIDQYKISDDLKII